MTGRSRHEAQSPEPGDVRVDAEAIRAALLRAESLLMDTQWDNTRVALARIIAKLAAAEARAAGAEHAMGAERAGLHHELSAMRTRAAKAEQALRELVTATTTWDDDLSSYCDGDDRTRVREALVAARDVLAAAAGDTGETE